MMFTVRGKTMKIRAAFLVLAGLSLLTGCVAVVVGAGAGAGTFAYAEGALKRS